MGEDQLKAAAPLLDADFGSLLDPYKIPLPSQTKFAANGAVELDTSSSIDDKPTDARNTHNMDLVTTHGHPASPRSRLGSM